MINDSDTSSSNLFYHPTIYEIMRKASKNDGDRFTGGNFLNYMLDQLSELENFTFKKIFGGIDFYRDGYQFGTIRRGKFLLQADPACSQMSPSRPHFGEDKDTFDDTQFFEVPEEIIANKSILKKMGRTSFLVCQKEIANQLKISSRLKACSQYWVTGFYFLANLLFFLFSQKKKCAPGNV